MSEMFKNFKLTDRDKFLLTVFIVCCVLIAVMAHSLADDKPVGMIIVHPTLNNIEWTVPDGKCLMDKEYPELAEALHEKDNWPYGRCDADNFRLPNLLDQNGYTPFKIKVK